MAEQSPKLDGWKSKWGGILLAAGSAIGAASEVAPNPELGKWMIFLGVLIGGVGTALLGVGVAHKVQKAGGTALKILILGILSMALLGIPAEAGQKIVTFGWEQTGVDAPDFYGWKLWVGETPGGPYTYGPNNGQLNGDIVYDGTPKPEYIWTSPPLVVPDGEEETFYFVANSWDKSGNFSANSNEVSLTIDFKPPTDPNVTSAVPPITTDPNLVLDGTKEANSGILINGTEVVPVGAQTLWSHTYKLTEGPNTLDIVAKDAAGNLSGATSISVELDTQGPSTPVKLQVTIVSQ